MIWLTELLPSLKMKELTQKLRGSSLETALGWPAVLQLGVTCLDMLADFLLWRSRQSKELPWAVYDAGGGGEQGVHGLVILNNLWKLFWHMQERKGYTEQSMHVVTKDIFLHMAEDNKEKFIMYMLEYLLGSAGGWLRQFPDSPLIQLKMPSQWLQCHHLESNWSSWLKHWIPPTMGVTWIIRFL